MEYNIIKKNGKLYKFESFWQEVFNTKGQKDEKNRIYPTLKNNHKKTWHMKKLFLYKLKKLEENNKNNSHKKWYKFNLDECTICKGKINNVYYIVNGIVWHGSLLHYVLKHNIIPSESFIDFVIRYDNNGHNIIKISRTLVPGKIIAKYDKTLLKLHKNQIYIMDSLMEHGQRKIYSVNARQKLKFSEHAGLLDFDTVNLSKILVYANTNVISRGDSEIFFPNTLDDAFNYEYIFHTHPPTHGTGGRAKLGILYEFPSISDIFHFLEHYNNGRCQGSIVIAPEGMYIIRKLKVDNKKILVDEDALFDGLSTIFPQVQMEAIDKWSDEFETQHSFMSGPAQDYTYIKQVNQVLSNYQLHIDYYSRIYEHKAWIIDTIYLPVFTVEQQNINNNDSQEP